MAMVREMAEEDRPRERFAASPKQAGMTDLIAILLRTGCKGCSVIELAGKVMKRFGEGGVRWYEDLDWHDLQDIPGIGKDKAITICAAIELGRRLTVYYDKKDLVRMNEPGKVAKFFMERLRHETQEHFFVCYVNVKNRLLGEKEISIGSLNAAPVDMKEALKWGIRYKAYGLILVHNHPSGDPSPSREDISLTGKFARAARLLDMEVLDHVIIGDGDYVSLSERGAV